VPAPDASVLTTRLQEMSDASTHEPGSECRSCPVCLILRALEEVRPDVRAHLVAAGRELALALRAALASDSDSGRPSDVASDSDSGRPSDVASYSDSGRPSGETFDDESRRLRRIDIH
jgi:hypothetical protein